MRKKKTVKGLGQRSDVIHLMNFKMSLWTVVEKTPWGARQEKGDQLEFVVALTQVRFDGTSVTVVEIVRSTQTLNLN